MFAGPPLNLATDEDWAGAYVHFYALDRPQAGHGGDADPAPRAGDRPQAVALEGVRRLAEESYLWDEAAAEAPAGGEALRP